MKQSLPKIKEGIDYHLDGDKCRCAYCNKLYSKHGIFHHVRIVHLGLNSGIAQVNNYRKINNLPNPRKGWNQENHPEITDQVRKIQLALSKKRELGLFKYHKLTPEQRKSISLRMSKHNPGGRCHWFVVNGIKVQGTWERDFAENLTKLDIDWKRSHVAIPYIRDHKLHHYTPDFYLPKFDLFIEIKGFWWNGDKDKMKCVFSQNPEYRKRIRILASEDQINSFLSSMDV